MKHGSKNDGFRKLALICAAAVGWALLFGGCPVDSGGSLQYTITFDTHGGSEVQPLTADKGTVVNKPADPTQTGYTFLGWFDDAASGGTLYLWPHTLTADVTMHAQWWNDASGPPPAQYTITFDTHSGSEVQPLTAYAGTYIAKPSPDPIRTGYTFRGWYSAETGGAAYTWPHTLTANVTMHAQWQDNSQPAPSQYTVTFHLEGGGAPEPQTVTAGGTAAEPGLITSLLSSAGLYRGAGVDGWYTTTAYTTPWDFTAPVTKNLDLYAKWTAPSAVDISGQLGDHVLAKALAYIAAQTLSETASYAIVLDGGNYTLPGIYFSSDQPNINTAHAVITLAGKDPTNISPSSNGHLFSVTAGDLILDNNITLTGSTSNNRALVRAAGSSASLTMKTGAKITGNKASSSSGGGVAVSSNATFTMSGGEISGNTSSYSGGGVAVSSNATFTMNGGKISGNTAFSGSGVDVGGSAIFTMSGGEISGNTAFSGGGGGMHVDGATFTMSGGEISGNTASSGGGMYVSGATFTMSGGEISGNTASPGNGGGMHVDGAPFTMNGGKISGNTASSGGGVNVGGSATFTMSGGEISGNTSSRYDGGGVNVSYSGNFIMSGGEISGNTSSSGGGGVAASYGNFSKTGGRIYGDTDATHTPGSTENTATSGNTYGHAVYYFNLSKSFYYRDATLNAGDHISTSTLPDSGTGNGWTKQ
jgi:uncharacterized repeat protein (TIGR02543 family)